MRHEHGTRTRTRCSLLSLVGGRWTVFASQVVVVAVEYVFVCANHEGAVAASERYWNKLSENFEFVPIFYII